MAMVTVEIYPSGADGETPDGGFLASVTDGARDREVMGWVPPPEATGFAELDQALAAMLGVPATTLGRSLRPLPGARLTGFRGRVDVDDGLDVRTLPLWDPEEADVRDAAFERVVAAAPRSGRGSRGGGVRLIDAGPYDLDELAGVFADADLRPLAGGWVGCVVDALDAMDFPEVGPLARCLVVVATRLHGVTIPEGGVSLEGFDDDDSAAGMPGSSGGRLAHLLQGPGKEHDMVIKAERGRQQAEGKSNGQGGPEPRKGFVVHPADEAPPPPAKSTGGGARQDPLATAIAALKPGEWVGGIPASAKGRGPGQKVAHLRKKLGLTAEQLYTYKAADGTHVVRRASQ